MIHPARSLCGWTHRRLNRKRTQSEARTRPNHCSSSENGSQNNGDKEQEASAFPSTSLLRFIARRHCCGYLHLGQPALCWLRRFKALNSALLSPIKQREPGGRMDRQTLCTTAKRSLAFRLMPILPHHPHLHSSRLAHWRGYKVLRQFCTPGKTFRRDRSALSG